MDEFKTNISTKFKPFSARCPLKGHTYLNKIVYLNIPANLNSVDYRKNQDPFPLKEN